MNLEYTSKAIYLIFIIYICYFFVGLILISIEIYLFNKRKEKETRL